jgi:hypothetical protein
MGVGVIMDVTFTSAELRIAAKQAVTLALMSFCPDMRRSFLLRAEWLFAEADALENAGVGLAPARAVASVSHLGSRKTNRSRGMPISRVLSAH